jgi:hypothetical protein
MLQFQLTKVTSLPFASVAVVKKRSELPCSRYYNLRHGRISIISDCTCPMRDCTTSVTISIRSRAFLDYKAYAGLS